jgi:hypothetical protein
LEEDGGSFARSRGHYQEWRRGDLLVGDQLPPVAFAAWQVRDALFLDGPQDSAAAAQAAFLERVAEGRSSTPATGAQRAQARCYAALWRLGHGETSSAQRTVRQLEREVERPYSYAGCVGMIRLSLARSRGDDIRGALFHLDSVVREAPMPVGIWALPFPPQEEVENLTLARLLVQYGDTAGALAASRRRIYLPFGVWIYQSLPEFLREEGRLAALTGDKPGAIRAYTHYLALREDPDYAPWRAVRDSVRRELAQLVGEPRH